MFIYFVLLFAVIFSAFISTGFWLYKKTKRNDKNIDFPINRHCWNLEHFVLVSKFN